MIKEDKIFLDDKWLKAAVLGSLWASFEIIVGSLLHNLRVPFAGTSLSLFAVILLVSFSRIWPQRGIIIRAGIICALMKSISPSAVILGPMIGIFTEALIMEAVLLLTGRNLPGYLLGGAFAVLSSLLHKLANLLLIYGFDLIEVYVNLLNYAAAQLSLIKFTPKEILYILVGIYLIAGMLGGLAGYYIGSRAGKIESSGKPIRFSDNVNPTKVDKNRFSLLLLLFHLSFIVLTLIFFQKSNSMVFKTGISLTYLLFCLFYYNNISRRLLKPLFWVQLLIILVLAGLFLEGSDPENFSLQNALSNGWNIFMRALLVITSFSAISTELANPDIKQFLVRRGFQKLYMALQLSFSALPMMLERNSGLKSFFKNPVYSFSRLVAEAEDWLQGFKRENGEGSG